MTFMDSSSLTFWEIISEVGFILVIVGVVGEGAELVVEWIKRHEPEGTRKKRKWLLPVETLSFVILVVGLALEFLGSHEAMRIADAQNASLNKEAADARKDAGVAIESAAVVKKDAAIANERAGIANKLAGQANERAAIIEATNTALSLQVEALRSNNFELEVKALGFQQQLMQTSNRVVKIEPLNQPIKSITAEVYFVIVGTNDFDSLDLKSLEPSVSPYVLSYAKAVNSILILGKEGALGSLHCKNYDRQPALVPVRETAYSMGYNWPSGSMYGSMEFSNTNFDSWITRNNASTEDLDKNTVGLVIFLPGIHSGEEIASGSCVFTINGSIRRMFSVPKYTDQSSVHCLPMPKGP
jgi:hypothetical protein